MANKHDRSILVVFCVERYQGLPEENDPYDNWRKYGLGKGLPPH